MNLSHRLLALGLLVCSSIGFAAGGTSKAVESAAAGLQLPDYIGVLEFMGERTPRGSHVSRSYSYRAAGLALDIDVLDYDSTQLLAGIDSSLLKQQYEHAKEAARAAAPRRAKLLAEDVVLFGTDEHFPAREAVYRLTTREFENTSYLWLTSVQGRLLEIRFSVQTGFEEDGRVSRSEILAELGEAVAHAPGPNDPKSLVAAAPQMNVAIVWDPATPADERQLWMTYLLTRAAHTAKETTDHILPAGDHPASFEEEVRARLMAVSTFRNLKEQGIQANSAYFNDLDRVEAAGYLREYAWRYLRQDSWTTAPTGLQLKAFDKWRTVHLGHHVPVTRGRIALRLTTLR